MAIHFAGGTATRAGRTGIRFAGCGFAACVSGDRAYEIRNAGQQTMHEADVTCRRCLALMAKRIDPGAEWSQALGIPRRDDAKAAQ